MLQLEINITDHIIQLVGNEENTVKMIVYEIENHNKYRRINR